MSSQRATSSPRSPRQITRWWRTRTRRSPRRSTTSRPTCAPRMPASASLRPGDRDDEVHLVAGDPGGHRRRCDLHRLQVVARWCEHVGGVVLAILVGADEELILYRVVRG